MITEGFADWKRENRIPLVSTAERVTSREAHVEIDSGRARLFYRERVGGSTYEVSAPVRYLRVEL